MSVLVYGLQAAEAYSSEGLTSDMYTLSLTSLLQGFRHLRIRLRDLHLLWRRFFYSDPQNEGFLNTLFQDSPTEALPKAAQMMWNMQIRTAYVCW